MKQEIIAMSARSHRQGRAGSRLLAWTAFCASIVITACGSTGGPVSTISVTSAPSASPVPATYEELIASAAREFGDAYAGFGVVAGEPVVFVKHPGTGATEFQGVRITLVQYSLTELEELSDGLGKHFAALKELGLTLSTWGPNPESNSVRIGVFPHDAALEAKAVAILGQGPWEFFEQRPIST